ncbi:MAG TPA: protein kinase [Streptosporangiaceae bacterium]
MSRPQSRDSAPPDLPGYRFVRHLGAGGNAQVYLYEQDLPHREVAVKVLNESALSEAARRRFTAEANVTAGLAHRHIVQVFDAKVTNDGRPYIVMLYYPQPNLLVRARRAHLSVAEVLRIGIQIGSAVETSHRRGVLHRDIKPQNILTDSYGEPALTDFGIATTQGGDGPEGLSVPWSPPEILYSTGTGDQRSDVYSLGATLWHVLVGRSPFEQPGGDNKPFALMGRIKSDPVPATGRADVPGSLERLLRQAMAKDPAARPQTAMELIRGLQSVEQELRLPVTQPILPASDPGDTPGSEAGTHTHGSRTGQESRGQRVPPLWDGAVGDATIARGSQSGASWPTSARLPATDNRGGASEGRHSPAQRGPPPGLFLMLSQATPTIPPARGHRGDSTRGARHLARKSSRRVPGTRCGPTRGIGWPTPGPAAGPGSFRRKHPRPPHWHVPAPSSRAAGPTSARSARRTRARHGGRTRTGLAVRTRSVPALAKRDVRAEASQAACWRSQEAACCWRRWSPWPCSASAMAAAARRPRKRRAARPALRRIPLG